MWAVLKAGRQQGVDVREEAGYGVKVVFMGEETRRNGSGAIRIQLAT